MISFLWNCIMLALGFFLLIKGADYFVDGCASIAAKLRIPGMIVGLTVVAFGTSLPELSVSTAAAIKGENTIAVSNVLGSNFFNLFVVLGACALVRCISVRRDTLKREYPLLIFISFVLLLLFTDDLQGALYQMKHGAEAGATSVGMLRWTDGLILLVFFVLFMVITVRSAIKGRTALEEEDEKKPFSPLRCTACVLIGLAGICIGGDLVVDYAKALALMMGMSDTLVGLTIVALGTSLPELVTSLVASKKGENDMAVGNVIGSNIFNILIVLGISCTVSPVAISMENLIDGCLLLVGTVVMYPVMMRNGNLKRAEGVLMLGLYAVYLGYIILR